MAKSRPLTDEDLQQLHERLTDNGYPEDSVKHFMSYVDSINYYDKEGKPQTHGNNVTQLYKLFTKFYTIGIVIDGVNAVITGKNMVMITFHGYKNVVIHNYPEAEFDIQLVKESDDFQVAKESGAVVYSHQIGDPFSNEAIKGAYCVIKTKRGEFFESLTKEDFEKMKNSSKQSYLWNQWESEFWLKSVMKRACKRHFYDIVAEIDKQDNADFGASEDKTPDTGDDQQSNIDEAIKLIQESKTMDELKERFLSLDSLMRNKQVIQAKDERKQELENQTEEAGKEES